MTAAGPRSRQRLIDRAAVVGAAQEIARCDGMDAVTMHGVARTLKVTPMALYRHVRDRAELVDCVIDAVNSEVVLPPDDHQAPEEEQLVAVLRTIHRHYAQYRGLAALLLAGGVSATPGSIRISEWVLAQFAAFGVEQRAAAVGYLTFREFFLSNLIPEHEHDGEGAVSALTGSLDTAGPALRATVDVTAEDRLDFALDLFLDWLRHAAGDTQS